MTAITRRAALRGATAAVAVAGVPTAVAAHEPLVALEAELMEARAAGVRAAALWNAAHDKAGAWAFGWPRVDFSTPAMAKMRGWYECNSWPGKERAVALGEIREFNRHAEMLVFGDGEVLASRKAEGRERVRWWIKARRAQNAAKEAAGMLEVEALMDSNCEREDAIEDALWDTPAETMRGVLIRLREAHRDYIAVQCCDGEEDFYAQVFGKVLHDLERLSGGLPS